MNAYHISDLKKFSRCERLYYMSKDEKVGSYQPFLRSYESVNDLIKQKYGLIDENTYFEGKVGDNPSLVMDNLSKYDWFYNARFEYQGLRTRASLLKKKPNGSFILYFINLVLYPKDDDLMSSAATYYVLVNNGLKISEIRVIHLNSKYVRRKELNPNSLFKETKYYYNHNNNLSKKLIKSSIVNYEFDFEEMIKRMDSHSLDDFEAYKKPACNRHLKCPMYEKCFNEYEDKTCNSILTLNSSKNKQNMYDNGIKYLKDADIKAIEGTRLQFAQIMADRNNGIYVEKMPLKLFMDKIDKFPISFIDFEWDSYLIPPFKGMKAYDVLCFQYSCHVLHKDGTITHKEFIDVFDSRVEFIKHLINDVAKEGPVVAYNAIGAEAVRLKELASMFPEYKEELMNIVDRFVDLAYPFISGIVYDTRMSGNYSLKSLLKAVSDYSYDELDIGEARLAVKAHRLLEDGIGDPELLRKQLFEYCGLDTYSMIVVYNWLKTLL